MDGCGAGEAPDVEEFGDFDHPATIKHVWEKNPGLHLPILKSCGFLAACRVPDQLPAAHTFKGLGYRYGRLQELSKGGKDSVTGHWEMAGIVTNERFPTYPNGFPDAVINDFGRRIGTKFLGNKAASGTEIISELGSEHLRTGYPILYTSADSVFQVACHEAKVRLDTLYDWCEEARHMLVSPNNIQRVIARPFVGSESEGFQRTGHRKDFPLPAPPNLCDKVGDVFGIGVIPELFAGRGFRNVKRTQSNAEHASMLLGALESDARFIWANFEDFDMKFGHRNDVPGFGNCLEEFDKFLADFLPQLQPEDLLILTADHGNDPTSTSTDHSREYVPFVTLGQRVTTESLGDIRGMNNVGASVARHLGLSLD